MAAYRAGIRAGIDPVQFWKLTPYLTAAIVTAAVDRMKDEHQARAWLAYTTAALGRAKRMPPFAAVAGGRTKPGKPSSQALSAQIRDAFMNYEARRRSRESRPTKTPSTSPE